MLGLTSTLADLLWLLRHRLSKCLGCIKLLMHTLDSLMPLLR
jgi:hypothetical protein